MSRVQSLFQKSPCEDTRPACRPGALTGRTPFFSTADRILRLNLAATRWRGTPWRPNSSTVGAGVSCHNLPRALYIESHFLPDSFPKIESLPAAATAENQMETFLDGRPEFEPLQPFNASTLQPGDLLGLFIPMDNVGRRIRNTCVNHLGVVLPEGWFIHTLMKKNTDVDLYALPPWSQIIKAAWRPVVVAQASTPVRPEKLTGETPVPLS